MPAGHRVASMARSRSGCTTRSSAQTTYVDGRWRQPICSGTPLKTAQPRPHRRLADHRSAPRPPTGQPNPGAAAGRRTARPGGHSGAVQPGRLLRASTVRRSETARGDRVGPGQRSGRADRGRTDHRPGRHRAGRDPAVAQGSAEATEYRDPAHHPQHGRGRRQRRPGTG